MTEETAPTIGTPMPPATLAALKASIAAWEKKRDAERAEDVRLGFSGCPLCRLFFLSSCSCQGCPVSAASGVPGCVDTPYNRASAARDYWIRVPEAKTAWVKAAQAEIDFLVSLLPEDAR